MVWLVARGTGTQFPMEKWVEGKSNKAFLHFLPYLFDDFSKFRSTFGVLHFEKSSNRAKIRQKNFEWVFSIQPISASTYLVPEIRFQVHVPPLHSHGTMSQNAKKNSNFKCVFAGRLHD